MSHPRLCVTVAASTMAELRARRDVAARAADLVELRLDGARDADAAAALEGRSGPVIVTCRPRREGGRFDGSEEERLSILARAARLGAEFVDVEWDSAFTPILEERGGRGVVLSTHDFGGVPGDLQVRARAMLATSAEVVKIAITARSLADTIPLLELGRAARDARQVALVAMGTPGLATRLLPGRFGSCWTYAGDGVAPGQLPPDRLLSEFRFREITARTRLFGVVGRPVEHSVSPAIHNAAFGAAGVDAVHIPFAAADAADFRLFADAIGIAGASITAPFKVELMRAADEVAEDAAAAGAANTLRVECGQWRVRNTDIDGFLAPLDASGLDLRGARVAVLGAGGAARAVVLGLGGRGASVTVHGRNPAHAGMVAALAAGGRAAGGIPVPGEWDVLVNATPIGTWPDVAASPVAPGDLSGGRLVYDLVYNPTETRLLRDAAAAGCQTIGGLEMLLAQAAAQFEWWTGVAAPRDAMRAAALVRLGQMTGTK
jgi:3-dehydroquinate dehydratase / shikimate dehydrogenase